MNVVKILIIAGLMLSAGGALNASAQDQLSAGKFVSVSSAPTSSNSQTEQSSTIKFIKSLRKNSSKVVKYGCELYSSAVDKTSDFKSISLRGGLSGLTRGAALGVQLNMNW